MTLKIVTREVGDVVVADLSGKLILGQGPILRDAVKDVLAKGHRQIHFDLSLSSAILTAPESANWCLPSRWFRGKVAS
jgi:hypothetical protein